MLILSRLLLALWLTCGASAFADGPPGTVNPDGISGPNEFFPVTPPPPPFFKPTVQAAACNANLPVVNGVDVSPACIYTALCSGLACTGGNAVTGWTLVTQSCSGCFSLTSAGHLQGGVNAANVIAVETYTVTVIATNAQGDSLPVVQTIVTPGMPTVPTVQSNTCTITLPVTNGVNVSPACIYTALCGGFACSGGNAIISWTVTGQSCAGCFVVGNLGQVAGGANAGSVLAGNTYTVTVVANNATGPSAPLVQSIITPAAIVNCISYDTNQCITWNGVGNALTYQ